MRQRSFIIGAIISILLFFQIIVPTHIKAEEGERHSYLIMFEESVNEQVVHNYHGEINHTYQMLPMAEVFLTQENATALASHEAIQSVERNGEVNTQEEVIDWGVEKIKAPTVWERGLTGEGVKVAIIDTGVATEHPDLDIAKGAAFTSYTESFEDDNGHGTQVAGILSANQNDEGITGIAPECDLYVVKVLDENGDGYHSNVIRGIEWALEQGIDIINLSVGSKTPSNALETALQKAYEQGVLVVAAAGNAGEAQAGETNVEYPAAYDSVIAVSATDEEDERASFSATGEEVEIAAPGIRVLTTQLDGEVQRISGTSMAAPHVSGHLALLRQAETDASHEELRDMLKEQTIDLGESGRDPYYGYGRIELSSDLGQAAIPAPPTDITAKVTTKGLKAEVQLTWNAAEDGEPVKEYHIHRDGEEVGTVSANETTFTEKVYEGTYTYEIIAVGENGENAEEIPQHEVEVKTENLQYPTELEHSINGEGEVTLEWSLTGEVVPKYINIYRNGKRLIRLPGGTTKFYDSPSNGTYQYTWTTMDQYGHESKQTDAVEVTVGKHADEKEKERNDYLSTFTDVKATDWYYDAMNELAGKGIIKGYADETVRPEKLIPRVEAAIMFLRAKGFTSTTYKNRFTDVDENDFGAPAIQAAYEHELMGGYQDNTFRPNEGVTRGELAAMLIRSFPNIQGRDTTTFTDVSTNYFAKEAIEQVAAAGIAEGYHDGTFRPKQEVTRAEFSAFLYRAIKQAE